MALDNVTHANRRRKALAGVAFLALAVLACATGCSGLPRGSPTLQGTWFWKSDRTPASEGVKAIFMQQGSSLGGRAVYEDGSDYLLLEGSISDNGVASFSTFWKTLTRAEAAGDQEESLLSALGVCTGSACVIVILGLGAFLMARSRRGRQV